MNDRSLRVLEYPQILERVAALCVTDGGKAAARRLRPSSRLEEADIWLDWTDEATGMILRNGRAPMAALCNIPEYVHRAEIGSTLSMRQLLEIASSLRVVRDMQAYFDEDPEQEALNRLHNDFDALDPCADLEAEISKKIIGPKEMSDRASRALNQIRKEITAKNAQITDKLNRIISSSANEKVLQERIITVRNNRYAVPVKQEYRNQIPGIVLDKSATGATLFIEPAAVVQLNNELKILSVEEEKEIARILKALTEKIAAYKMVLIADYDVLVHLDFVFAKAAYGLNTGGVRVAFKDDRENALQLLRARHPLLDPRQAVASDIAVSKDIHTIVITGPNTGGKTVTLKTIGLLSVMIQSGLFVPAREGSYTRCFREVFADIGDEQSIEQSLSTFSAHMKNTVNFIDKAQKDDLVLFDELGAGTDPTEGAALAISLLEVLHARGVTTVATTHYSELKEYALTTSGIVNASVEFDVETLQPTYRLLIGIPGKSNAFEIAQKLGLKPEIIARARAYVSKEASRFEDTLDVLESKRREMERRLEEAERKELEAQEKTAQIEEQMAALKATQETILNEARAKADALVTQTQQKTEAIYREIREIQEHTNQQIDNKRLESLRKQMHNAHQRAGAEKRKKQKPQKQRLDVQTLKPGMTVYLENFHKEGEVLEVKPGTHQVLVQVGPMKIKVGEKELSVLTHYGKALDKKATPKKTKSFDRHAMNTRLDLRGRTTEEAVYMVEKFLSDAVVANASQLTIVHGKGTGVLQRVVQDYLKKSNMVRTFRFGNPSEGGTGATIVEL